MKKETNKTAVKTAVKIWRVYGYNGLLDHYFARKKEAQRFVQIHGLDKAIITPFLSEY